MKKKLTRLYSLFWAMLAGYLFLSFSSNPPNGYTGSPPTFNTCASSAGGCHSGGTGTGDVQIAGLPGTIDPSTTYPITVTINRSNAVPQEGGFQMNVLDASNNNFGTLSNPGPGSTVMSNYFEHNPSQPFSGDMIIFTVDWTSPSTGSTTVTMYAAAVLANGNNSSTGDAVVTTVSSGNFMGGAGPITVSVTGTDVNCFNGNDGTATAMPSGGGGGPYFYAWSNGGNTQTISNLTAGTYSVTVTNVTGDPGMGDVSIGQPSSPVNAIIINTTNITCTNPIGSASADGSGGTPGYSYVWSNGMPGPTTNVTSGGSYTVTVTDINQCTATATANIIEDTTPPIADAGQPMSITCANPIATLDGTGSSSGGNIVYQWTTSDGNIVSGANTATPIVNAAGTYTLTVTDLVNGCFAVDATIVVSDINPPVAVIAAPNSLNCAVTSIVLDGTGSSTGAGISYLWTTTNGNIVSGETTLQATVDAAGDYTFTVTNNTNGCSASAIITVSSDTSAPTADSGADMSLNCNNISVTLNGSGSSSGPNIGYLWTTSNGNIVSGETTTMPTVDTIGTYVLTVTNSTNSCTATDTVLVVQTPALVASISSQTNVDCNGNNTGIATAAGSGGNAPYSYAWSNGSMTQTAMNLSAGSYSVTITDEDNCTATAIATITQPTALAVTVTTSDESAPGANDGTATANPTGGVSPYSYVWSNVDTTQTIMNLGANTYSVTVTDANGCTATGSGVVNNYDCSTFTATVAITDVTCHGGSDGSATVTPSGGLMPYSYAWSNGDTTATVANLMAGNYTVTVLENGGCEEVLMVMIGEPTAVAVSTTTLTNVSCFGGNDGGIIVSVTGGTGSNTFAWSNGSMSDTLSNLSAGEYTVTATDMTGCMDSLTVTVSQPASVNLSGVSITGVLCHGDSTGAATVAASGGTPNYTYLWPGGLNGPSQSNLPANNYNVTATDINGCTATLQVIISEPAELAINVTFTDETAVGANDGTASSAPDGGVGGYTYIWNNGEITSMIDTLPPGQYCVTITDLNGCSETGCVMVNSFACLGASIATEGSAVSCFVGNDGSASAVPSGFTDPINFIWSNDSTTATIGGLIAGTYSVTVTDANGCSDVGEYVVTQPTELLLLGNVTNAECEDSANGSIMLTTSGGTIPYSYEWSNGESDPNIDSLLSGTYSTTVTDANGCTTTQEFEVGVDPDTELPNVVLQDITVALDSNGMVSITANMLDNGSTDNCGIDTMIVDLTDFTCDNLGENEVVVAVADLSNNCAFDFANVTVVDNIAPTIICPDNITVESDNCLETVDYNAPTVSDNCTNPTFELTSGSPPGSTFSSGTTTLTFVAMDASGNTSTCSFTITVDSGFSATGITSEATCFGMNDGTATAEPTGGVPPFTYLWSPSDQTTQTATNLPAGTYMVIVTDAEGCAITATVEVTEPPALEITIDTVVHETYDDMNGAIDVTVTGGTGTYSLQWSFNGAPFSNSEDLNGLADGQYVLSVVDDNGCMLLSGTVVVDQLNSTLDPVLDRFIELYPNPVSDKLFIQFDLPSLSEVSIDVFDLNGRLVMPATSDYFAKKTIALDVDALATGIYIVRLVVDNGVLVQRVVVRD